ncbi:MAG: acyltransferase [Lachnospiraceae bacterium]|nr:acyltransferase [Lachnospiraceae bacterium]
MKKIYFLDVLRLIAFVFIIVYHFIVELEIRAIYDFKEVGIVYLNENMHIATLGVALFFMISGAGLMLSTKDGLDLKIYYKKRFWRIFIPFYIVYMSYMLFLFAIKGGSPFAEGIPVWRFIFTLMGMDQYLATCGQITFSLGIGEWFLGCLILMYLVFPLLRKCMLKNKWVTLSVATTYFLVLVFNYHFQIQPYMNFFVKIYDFVLGMFLILVWEELQKLNAPVKIRIWSLVITVPVIGVFLFWKKSLPIPVSLKIVILAVAVFVFAMQFEGPMSSSRILLKVLQFVRLYSFEIFLVHHAIIGQFAEYYTGRKFLFKETLILFVVEMCIIFLLAFILKKAEKQIDVLVKNKKT